MFTKLRCACGSMSHFPDVGGWISCICGHSIAMPFELPVRSLMNIYACESAVLHELACTQLHSDLHLHCQCCLHSLLSMVLGSRLNAVGVAPSQQSHEQSPSQTRNTFLFFLISSYLYNNIYTYTRTSTSTTIFLYLYL